MLNVLKCTIGTFEMPKDMLLLPSITVLAVNLIKIAIPIILVIFGMVDLAKAVMSKDEKEMKEAQSKLIKRVIYAIAVFLVVSIVQLVFSAVAGTGAEGAGSVSGCISCFVSSVDQC